jgi:phosphoribosylanthranilate isomerase
MMTAIKICGLVRPEDAQFADGVGADYLGVVFAPSPRRRTEDQARRIWEGTAARRVGVFVDEPEDNVLRWARDLDLAVVQLHGSEDPDHCARIRDAGSWDVWKAARVVDGDNLSRALDTYAAVADGILLEGWSDRGHGGVGASFDWAIAASVRELWPGGLQLILAGGLNPDNVGSAIDQVRPDIVDVSSGVEAALGIKDHDAIKAFVDAAQAR